MTDREKAIDHFNRTIAQLKYLDGREDSPCLKYYIRVRNAKSRRRLLASRVALAALRAEEEREKGCEYCKNRFGIATHHVTESGMQAGTNKAAAFCPMCGRKLDGGGQE